MDKIKISITMTYVLRHHPEEFGIKLDEYGLTDINGFLEAMRKYDARSKELAMDNLLEIVATCPKQRYHIIDGKIGAQGGHNKRLGIKIIKPIAIPPDILYHGTTPEASKIIRGDGIRGMDRQGANLSIDTETAIIVGKRRCKVPVVLIVDCKKAYKDGIIFYREGNGIYSVEFMPAKYIK